MGKQVTVMLLLHWLTQYLQCGHTQGTGQSPWEMWPRLGSQELRHYQETIPPPSEPSGDPEQEFPELRSGWPSDILTKKGERKMVVREKYTHTRP